MCVGTEIAPLVRIDGVTSGSGNLIAPWELKPVWSNFTAAVNSSIYTPQCSGQPGAQCRDVLIVLPLRGRPAANQICSLLSLSLDTDGRMVSIITGVSHYHIIGEENKMLRISDPSVAIAMATVIFWPLINAFPAIFFLYVFACLCIHVFGFCYICYQWL